MDPHDLRDLYYCENIYGAERLPRRSDHWVRLWTLVPRPSSGLLCHQPPDEKWAAFEPGFARRHARLQRADAAETVEAIVLTALAAEGSLPPEVAELIAALVAWLLSPSATAHTARALPPADSAA